MPNKIKPKRSYTTNSVPLTTDLETNELAINWADGKAFTKDANGQIVSVTLGGSGGGGGSGLSWATAPASATATGTAGQIAYDGDYFYVATATNTWKRTTLASWSLDDYIQYVALLLHCDGSGATFTDTSSTPKTVTANGGATQNSTQSKWGGRSAYFDGSGDYLTFGSANLSFGTGDFAIEMWIYPTATQTSFLADWRLGGASGPAFYLQNNVMNFYDGGSLNVGASSTVSSNTWTHVAAARSGGTLRLYQGGSLVGTLAMGTNMTGSGSLSIAYHNNVFYTGYMDDIRITIGSARGYTGSTITVPTAAFPDP